MIMYNNVDSLIITY